LTTHRSWRGAVEVDVALDKRAPDDPDTVRGLAYPALVGKPITGDRVLLNTNAVRLGLGTGGYALVIALPDRLPLDTDDLGHIMKARYTPQQVAVLAVDEEASPYRALFETTDTLDGLPVVVADLHSALPALVAGVLADRPNARVAYVMTDGGALPAWFSRNLDALADLLVGVITVGQAFGGDLEATNTHSGLLAARHALGADIAIVTQGPGNLGTGTPWGFSGVSVGEVVNAVASLHGRPIGSIRLSTADHRPRHRGISHHSLTAYGKVALAPADLVLPQGCDPTYYEQLAPLAARHRIVTVDSTGLDESLRKLPVKLSTMGRSLDEEHDYFLAAAAAGRHAVTLLSRSPC
jgi:hypothetical protein